MTLVELLDRQYNAACHFFLNINNRRLCRNEFSESCIGNNSEEAVFPVHNWCNINVSSYISLDILTGWYLDVHHYFGGCPPSMDPVRDRGLLQCVYVNLFKPCHAISSTLGGQSIFLY